MEGGDSLDLNFSISKIITKGGRSMKKLKVICIVSYYYALFQDLQLHKSAIAKIF